MINIPKNTYSTPVEVRDFVVEKICESFLQGCIDSKFHPVKDGRYRNPTLKVEVRNGKGWGFVNSKRERCSYDYYDIRGVEMKRAFKELIDAGYFMFRIYSYGTWLGYVCSSKPVYPNGVRVYEFNDTID